MSIEEPKMPIPGQNPEEMPPTNKSPEDNIEQIEHLSEEEQEAFKKIENIIKEKGISNGRKIGILKTSGERVGTIEPPCAYFNSLDSKTGSIHYKLLSADEPQDESIKVTEIADVVTHGPETIS